MNCFYFIMLIVLSRWMKNKEAFNLKPYLPYYNLSCFFLASYCAYHTLKFVLSKNITFACNQFDFSDAAVKQLIFVYLY